MRLFAAIWPPEEALDEIAAWWTAAGVHLDGWGWREVPRESWHLTLAFYGEVSGRGLDALADALEGCACDCPPLALTTEGMGVFPSAERPRVFWLGVREADRRARGLARLARCCLRALDATVRAGGKRREQKTRFVGHLTLARMRGEPLPLEVDAWRELPDPPQVGWTAYEITLVRSRLGPDRARYEILERFPLMGVER